MEQPRGRSPLQGDRQHISPVPSPRLYHDSAQHLGFDPSVNPNTFTTGAFNTAQSFPTSQPFTTPYLESSQQHHTDTLPQDLNPNFYSHNHFDQPAFHENQFSGQPLEASYAQNDLMYQTGNMPNDFASSQQQYSYDQNFEAHQQANVNPAELSKMSSPQDHASPNLLSPDNHNSPGQPASPTSTNGQYYTPQHSRHQSLDPSSAYSVAGEFQNPAFQQFQHHRTPSNQSEVSSNTGYSPNLGHPEVFDSVENHASPYMHPQPDTSNDYGLGAFSLQPPPSPGHSPYVSPRLIPNQGLGLGQDLMLNQSQSQMPGPEIYTTQAESYSNMVPTHNRHGSTFSDMGQADQFAPPIIQIDPAPVSRQNSFEPGTNPFGDGNLSPRTSRGRSLSDVTGNKTHPGSQSRSPSAAGRSPSLQPTHNLSVRSASPNPQSRSSSPGAGNKSRRASTSSINSREYILDLADPNRPNASPSHQSARIQKHPANFQCHLCPKKFTRAYNLRSHLRTHTDERPFVCTVCSKAFARQHDRKRHEGLHSGEKKFVCKGELHSVPGTMWGCGRRFARADALGRHFRSEAGRICIKPLLDEERAERQQKMMQDQAQFQMQNPGMELNLMPGNQQMMYADTQQNYLPASLLAQFPDLQKIDWSQVSNTQDDGGLSGNELYEDEEEDGYLSDMPSDQGQGQQHMGYPGQRNNGISYIESMQVIALSRPLPRCSRQSVAALCDSPHSSRPRLASLVASRTYHASRVSCAAKNEQESHARPNFTAADHPLSIQNLRNLAEDVPHTFFSRSTSPYFNLAVEHHLLTYSHPSSRILFTYANTPCVIIGRNQNPWVECDIRAMRRGTADGRHVELIRRRSGGGTVFHDEGNLNYTVIVPAEGFERRTHVQMVVDALVALREKEYVSRRWQEVKVNERNDIVARLGLKYRQEGAQEEWFKVSGTAFKLTRGRALHHGTLLHSSPYIDSIGPFLRSPGKDFITAKGVESVRSPVTNLWSAPKARQRRLLSYTVRRTIEHMWARKYAAKSSNSPESIQVANGQPEDLIPELMAGIRELRTQAWRWDQTPSFSFDSKEIVIGGQSLQLGFDVKNGVIQSVKASEELQATYRQLLVGQSIKELSALDQWQELLTDGEMTTILQKALIQLLETCFPPLENKSFGNIQYHKPEASSAETQEQSSHALSDNKQVVRYGGRLYPNEVGMLHKLDTAIKQLGDYLIKWSILWRRVSNISVNIPRAGNMIRKMGRMWLHLVLDDLTAATEQVNSSVTEVQRTIIKLLKRPRNRAGRQAKVVFQPIHARLTQIASNIRAQSLQLTRILTRVVVEERERAARRSARVGLYDDDEGMSTNEQKDTHSTPEISAEARSNAQSILEATLAMIDQQDRRDER